MVNVGIVGYGGLGHVHTNSLWQLDQAKVKSVCDINPEQLAKKEVQFNIEQAPNEFDISTCNTYTDFDEMMDSETLDAVVVALPTYIHAEYAIKAMDRGCHVICEKPMAMNPAECDAMIEARDRNNRQLMIAQCLRFWPEYEYLYETIKNQPFGKFHSLLMQRVGSYPFADKSNWFGDHEKSGGALLDLHVHDLDFMQMALGNPDVLHAVGVRGWTGGIDDHTGIFKYAEGTAVTIRCSWMQVAGFQMSYVALFEDATLIYSSAQQPTLQLTRRGKEEAETIEVETESAYLREMRYFMECAAGEHENTRCTAESTRNSIKLAREEERLILEGK